MDSAGEARALTARQVLATAAVVTWLSALALVTGPARWEFAHTYGHWIEGAEHDLPELTRAIALPVLGLSDSSLDPAALLYWGAFWVWPLIALWLIWRARTRLALLEVLSISLAVYGALAALLSSLLAVSLWLPFSLL